MCCSPGFSQQLFTTYHPTFCEMPSPHALSVLATARNTLPSLIPGGRVLGRSQPGVWCDPASEARLRDAGDAVRLWPAEIGTGRVGLERHTGAPRSLGGCGPDRKRRAYSHRADPKLGEDRFGRLDGGGKAITLKISPLPRTLKRTSVRASRGAGPRPKLILGGAEPFVPSPHPTPTNLD